MVDIKKRRSLFFKFYMLTLVGFIVFFGIITGEFSGLILKLIACASILTACIINNILYARSRDLEQINKGNVWTPLPVFLSPPVVSWSLATLGVGGIRLLILLILISILVIVVSFLIPLWWQKAKLLELKTEKA